MMFVRIKMFDCKRLIPLLLKCEEIAKKGLLGKNQTLHIYFIWLKKYGEENFFGLFREK